MEIKATNQVSQQPSHQNIMRSPLQWLFAFACWTVCSFTCIVLLAPTTQWLFAVPEAFIAYLGMLALLKRASPIIKPKKVLSAHQVEELTWWHTLYLCFILGLTAFYSAMFGFAQQSTQYVPLVLVLFLPGLVLWVLIHMQPQALRDEAKLHWAANLGVITIIAAGLMMISWLVFFLMLMAGGSLDGNS